MTDREDRPSAWLTKKQREFLRNPEESDLSARGKRAAWSRIRERVYHGLRDGFLLWTIPREQRQEIFDYWKKADEWITREHLEDLGADGQHDTPASIERFTLISSLQRLLAFLYQGVEETEECTFEGVLEQAVKRSVEERDKRLEDFTFQVEISEPEDLDGLLNRFERMDPTLDQIDIVALLKSGKITTEDISKYYKQLSGGTYTRFPLDSDVSRALRGDLDFDDSRNEDAD